MMVAPKIVVVFTIKDMSYFVVGIFDDLVGPFCIFICYTKFFDQAVCFNLATARKGVMPFPDVI